LVIADDRCANPSTILAFNKLAGGPGIVAILGPAPSMRTLSQATAQFDSDVEHHH
jgi:hypothetical protein